MPITRRDALKLTLVNAALASSSARADEAAVAATTPEMKTLDIVFEGGGIKGAAFCGALEVLETRGYTYRHLIGTSAGAITAALLAAGYNAKEMQAILKKRDDNGQHVFNTFLLPTDASAPETEDTPRPRNQRLRDWFKEKGQRFQRAAIDRLPGNFQDVASDITAKVSKSSGDTKTYWNRMLALLSTGAFANDANFRAWLCERLNESPLLKNRGWKSEEIRSLTLGTFEEATRAQGIQLSVVATDVTGMRSLVLNHHTASDVPLVDAIRMSMGIPIVWPEIEWKKKEWGPYFKTYELWDNKDDAGNRIVDGGVLSNFPLRYLIDPGHMTDEGALGKPERKGPAAILGLLLDETTNLRGVTPSVEKKHLAERLLAYQTMTRVFSAMSGAADQEAIDYSRRPENAGRGLNPRLGPLCQIPVKGYETLDFNMDKDRMAKLIQSGHEAMEEYLLRRV